MSGEVPAYDRVANVLVLEDRTVRSLDSVPESLAAGLTVTIDDTSNVDDGWQKQNCITVSE